MKKLILSLFCSIFFISMGAAQDLMIFEGTTATCAANFTDSGGSGMPYSADEDFTLTICSPFPNDQIQVDFTDFDLAPGALLFIYDGDNANIGTPLINNQPFFGSNSPGLVQASNPTGCLTFRFQSFPGVMVADGWQATVTCFTNCQPITSSIVSVPPADVDGILRVCQGEQFDFTGSGTFAQNSTGGMFKFILPDGTESVGTTLTQSFDDPGIYSYDFVVESPDGCRDRRLEDIVVFVSTTPDFTGTEAADSDICLGDSVDITGMVETTEFFAEVAPPVAGVTRLPDGPNDPMYQTCIEVQGFGPGVTFQNASDLIDFFINIEHSYLGDLTITLSAPNGSEVDIIRFPNGTGGTFLGIPIEPDSNLTPGTGFTYVFNETTGTQTLQQAANGQQTIPAGDYNAVDPFSAFIGTELNGLWCLTITDNLGSDDGNIFEWGLNFNPAIIPDAGQYEPDPVLAEWDANSDIVATNGNVITVTPQVAGQNCYDYNFTDSFGCTYTETVCINVLDGVDTEEPDDIIICQVMGMAQVDLTQRETQVLNGLDPTLNTVGYYNTRVDAESETMPIADPTAVQVSGDTTYFVRVTNNATGCFSIEELDVVFTTVVFNTAEDLEFCDDLSADGTEVFDLTVNEADILGSQSPVDFTVGYFNTQMQAEDNMDPITDPTAYVGGPSETIFVRVSNAVDDTCFVIGTFNIDVLAAPSIGTGMDITECDDSPIDNALSSFDFTVNDSAVLNGQSASEFTVTYYTSQSDADNDNNPITATSTVTAGTIYARITSNVNGCFNTSSFNLIVEACEVVVPEGFSPNADGVNDTFSIPNIEQYENFELKVFNRLGSVVYETTASNYEEFAGIPNSGLNSGDGLLPVGTYFYVIKYNDSAIEDVASWVYINY